MSDKATTDYKRSAPKKKRAPLVLKMNKDGQYPVPFNKLSQLKVLLPPGFSRTGLSLVLKIGQTTEAGFAPTKEIPTMTSINDVNSLRRAPGLVREILREDKTEQDIKTAEIIAFRAKAIVKKISLPENFRSEEVRCLKMATNIRKSLEQVDSNKSPSEDDSFRTILIESGKKMKDAISSYLVYLASANKSEKKTLKDFLRDKGVPTFLTDRMMNVPLNITQGYRLSSIFFPSNFTKGLKLFYDEWINPECQKLMEPVLVNSKIFQKFFQEGTLRELLQIPRDTSLKSLDDSLIKELFKQSFFVVPIVNWIEVQKDLMGRQAYKLRVEEKEGKFGILHHINATLFNLYLIRPSSDVDAMSFWKTHVPGPTYLLDTLTSGTYRQQFLRYLDLNPSFKPTFEGLFKEEKKISPLLSKWLRLPSDMHSTIRLALNNVLSDEKEKKVELTTISTSSSSSSSDSLSSLSSGSYEHVSSGKIEVKDDIKYPHLDTLVGPIQSSELSDFEEFRKDKEALLLRKQKTNFVFPYAATSPLSERAKGHLTNILKNKEMLRISSKLKTFLQSFENEAIQIEAAKVMEATASMVEEQIIQIRKEYNPEEDETGEEDSPDSEAPY